MTGNEVRRKFLEYFERHNHRIVRSASLVPQDDPTLLFVNAGMVQFKRTFLGEEKRGYNRAVTSQKCVRAGGKHNDLENVGYTARHHTFFEMLGNFSFGDYFKEGAIEFGWDLLTNGFNLPVDKLWISIYLDDDEAHDLWHTKIGVPMERIVRFGEKDNFWAMGDTGPCGPCSEIHLDRGAAHGCGKPDCALGCECDRFLEIWNLVFMQFDRDASGTLTPLPKPSIDTGLGLERMASIAQDVNTNYDTDLILPIIHFAADMSGVGYGESTAGDVALKVIADHSRAAAFLIGDGILPSNEGRGYVLRRIMRRAIRYGRQIGLNKPFLHRTAEKVFEIMAPEYPELGEAGAFIGNVIQNEEVRFSETLDKGMRLLNENLNEVRAAGHTVVPGDLIFKLYDTFGFPVDIVRDVVRDEGLELDMDGFNRAMAGQRAKSRSVATFAHAGDAYKGLSSSGFTPQFVGYDTLTCDSQVALLVKNGKAVDRAAEGDEVEVVTAVTPFYGEAGGQVGDHGTLSIAAPSGAVLMEISDTLKDPTGLIIHKGQMRNGTLKQGSDVSLAVDADLRGDTARNHTATHILHYALRKVLGEHVKQSGSLVSAERFRFDFTHFSQVSPEELEQIETLVNDRIRENVPVEIREMDAEEAFKSGATALFEEKYGDRVRVISLGDFSRELCGGTHTSRTGNIGLFQIVAESSIAAGVRRIEALTGRAAVAAAQNSRRILAAAAARLKEKPDQLAQRLDKMVAQQKALEKDLENLKTQMAFRAADGGDDETETINDTAVIIRQVSVDSPAALRELADRFKDKLKSGVVVLGSAAGSKAFLIAGVTKDLTSRYHAGNIIKAIAGVVGGGGGGRPDMAQAGGSQPENLAAALERARKIISTAD